MIEGRNEFDSLLPKVTHDDIIDASLERLLTPTATYEQWKQFEREQPELAAQMTRMIQRSFPVEQHEDGLEQAMLKTMEQRESISAILGFAASAIRNAARRERANGG